jgi:N-acetylglucosamine kinase-like BadF-type ATPase
MAYYLGVDGGGTKTKVCVIDETKRILYEGKGGPSSTDTVSAEATYQSIFAALEGFFSVVGKKAVFKSVFVGLGGVLTESDFQGAKTIIKRLPGVTENTSITIRNDMENALASGEAFDEGIVLIAGTGMVAFGRDKRGNTYKSGGWGFREGDQGSAFDLGKQAMKKAIRSMDGRGKKDDFTEAIREKIGLEKTDDILPVTTRLYQDRTKVAALSKDVTAFADQGNETALKIIEDATSELALAVKAVYEHVCLDEPKVVIVGALGNAGGRFSRMLHDKITKIDSKIKIQGPSIDPAYAAAILSLNA